MQCAMSSSPINRCAAGISLDFSSISMWARIMPASVSNACSSWAALRSRKLSKLRLSVFPSSAMVRRVGLAASPARPAACRRIEALEDVADGGMSGRALPAQPEGGVQPAAVDRDEGFDGSKGVPAGHHGEDREQQNMRQLIELPLGSARVGDFAEQAEQMIERWQGNLLAVGCRA